MNNGYVNIAVRAARAAGEIIVRSSYRMDTIQISTKQQNDFVTSVDKQAEQEIINVLLQSFPDHGVLGEEGGLIGNQDSEFQWIIDPLDGTTNFIHGNPQYAVSIALLENNRPVAAVVYDPLRQELFTAAKGEGAELDGKRIRVSTTKDLQLALVGTGLPYRDFDHLDAYLNMLKAVITNSAGIRRPGSAALDLAWLAAGRIDAFWELGLKPWDIAAGALLITEAGGYIGDISGGNLNLSSGNIVAGNRKSYAGLMKVIAPHVPEALR